MKKKIVYIGYSFNAPKELKSLCNNVEPLIIYDDNTTSSVDGENGIIYEYNNSIHYKDIWILSGHEEVIVLNEFGEEVASINTR